MESRSLCYAPATLLGLSAGQNAEWGDLRNRINERIQVLKDILERGLLRYTDLPVKDRLFVEDIDSFRKVRDVKPGPSDSVLARRLLQLDGGQCPDGVGGDFERPISQEGLGR